MNKVHLQLLDDSTLRIAVKTSDYNEYVGQA